MENNRTLPSKSFHAELLRLSRQVRIHRDAFDLLIVDGDTPFVTIKECEEKIDIATKELVDFLRDNDKNVPLT